MKITSGRLLLRYAMAASALSAASTSMSYFSRARARNTRADFESSTINARFALMPHPQRRAPASLESVAQNTRRSTLSRSEDDPAADQTSVGGPPAPAPRGAA